MTERATYALYVDWNGDGDFVDAGEDISDDWISINISRGYSSPLARFPSVGRMDVVLRNAAQTYSPPSNADARPERAVRLDMTYDGNTETLFRGWIETLRPEFGTRRGRRAIMECVDAISLLDRYQGEIALLTNSRADEIIEDVVAAVYTPPSTSYDVGINTFPTAADRWSGVLTPLANAAGANALTQTVRASDKILDACEADWGRFFISGAGVPTFHNRHHMPFDSTTVLTLDDTMVGMDYQMSGESVYDVVEVTCHPRKIGATNEVLGELDQTTPPPIEDGDSVTFDIRFRDPSNTAVTLGGLNVITPVATTDYKCTDDEPGEGTDETANVGVSMTAYGDHAEVQLTNNAGHIVYLQTLRVRGIAVRSWAAVTIMASQASDQPRRLSLDAALMSNPVHAQSLADWLLDYYGSPLHDVRNNEIIGNSSAALMAAVRDLDLMDRVVVTESQTGLSAQAGYIYAMRHTIQRGRIHRLIFDLEQAYDYGADPWTWDTSTWDGGDVWVY